MSRICAEDSAQSINPEAVGLSQRKIHILIAKSRITDLRHGGQHS